jgi:hypothetical protein
MVLAPRTVQNIPDRFSRPRTGEPMEDSVWH